MSTFDSGDRTNRKHLKSIVGLFSGWIAGKLGDIVMQRVCWNFRLQNCATHVIGKVRIWLAKKSWSSTSILGKLIEEYKNQIAICANRHAVQINIKMFSIHYCSLRGPGEVFGELVKQLLHNTFQPILTKVLRLK